MAAASVRKFQKVAWLTWAGFVSIFTAVFIVVYGFPILPFGPSCTHRTLPLHMAGCTLGFASIAFILVEAIPIFNYLIALTGSICFAPLAFVLPGWLWLHDHGVWRRGNLAKQIAYWLHWGMVLLGAFVCGWDIWCSDGD